MHMRSCGRPVAAALASLFLLTGFSASAQVGKPSLPPSPGISAVRLQADKTFSHLL